MFTNRDDLRQYIFENFTEVTDSRIDDDHWDLICTHCKITRGFQVIRRDLSGEWSRRYSPPRHPDNFDQDFDAPFTCLFRCPVCHAFKQWIVYKVVETRPPDSIEIRYFRVTSVPSEGLEEIDELPQNPPSLRVAYRQAIRAMDANAQLAAAAMFRRALQVITRDILGARPGILGVELNELVGKTYNGGVLTKNFADVGYIIKEAGNQGAHPDKDPEVLEFTPADAQDLQNIFIELVTDLFVVPAATAKARAEFIAALS